MRLAGLAAALAWLAVRAEEPKKPKRGRADEPKRGRAGEPKPPTKRAPGPAANPDPYDLRTLARCVARKKPPTRAPMFFLHLHKAGGTTMSKLAEANDECVPCTEDRTVLARDKGSWYAKNMNPSSKDAARAPPVPN